MSTGIERALERFRALPSSLRHFIQFALDAVAWAVAITAATIIRFDFDVSRANSIWVLVLILEAAVLQLIVGWLVHLYRGRHFYASFDAVRALAVTILITGLIVSVPVAMVGNAVGLARSSGFIAIPIAFVLMGGGRYLVRLVSDRMIRPSDDAKRTLVYGAGYLGSTIIRRMLTDRKSAYAPVGILDDSPLRRRSWIDGVRVLGTGDDIVRVAETTGATVLVVAIASADAELLRAIADQSRAANLTVKVLPPLDEILAGRSNLRDLRDISIEDLIGRHPVDTQVESVAGYLTGKRVLVTGAGGSIGSELCRQVSKFEPAELIMLDHDETGLQGVQISISGHGLLDTRDVVLGSIRDADTIMAIFQDRRPEVVFHAAALKHLPMLEQYPAEAWQSNVLGTQNVLTAAQAVGVQTFVNISTDKAANPTSVLGHSKRLAERLTTWAAKASGMNYLSVRFGNVIGSRGSMLPTFRALIEAGSPLTITHPDATRFFMTIPEACQLVVQAGGIGNPGEVLILDMGAPVRILDVAQRMIDMSGRDVEIIYTGLRPGEKLHEELTGIGEIDERRVHPKISHTSIEGLDPATLDMDASLAAWALSSTERVGSEARQAHVNAPGATQL